MNVVISFFCQKKKYPNSIKTRKRLIYANGNKVYIRNTFNTSILATFMRETCIYKC